MMLDPVIRHAGAAVDLLVIQSGNPLYTTAPQRVTVLHALHRPIKLVVVFRITVQLVAAPQQLSQFRVRIL